MYLFCGRCSKCSSRVSHSFNELTINDAYYANETAGPSLSDGFEVSLKNKISKFVEWNCCNSCKNTSSFEFETAIFPVVVQLDIHIRVSSSEVKLIALEKLSVIPKTITINVSLELLISIRPIEVRS